MRFIYKLTTFGLIILLLFSHLILGSHFISLHFENLTLINEIPVIPTTPYTRLFLVLLLYILCIIVNVMMYLTINSRDSYKFSFDKNFLLKLYYINSTFIVFLFSSIILSSIFIIEKNFSNFIPITILLISCLHHVFMTSKISINTAKIVNTIYISFLFSTFLFILFEIINENSIQQIMQIFSELYSYESLSRIITFFMASLIFMPTFYYIHRKTISDSKEIITPKIYNNYSPLNRSHK